MSMPSILHSDTIPYTYVHTPSIIASKKHIKLLSDNYKGNKSQVSSSCTTVQHITEKLSHFHKIMRNYPLFCSRPEEYKVYISYKHRLTVIVINVKFVKCGPHECNKCKHTESTWDDDDDISCGQIRTHIFYLWYEVYGCIRKGIYYNGLNSVTSLLRKFCNPKYYCNNMSF